MGGQMLLTIGIPTYGRADDLDRLLASIAAELAGLDDECVEVVVVDNASEDRTPEVLTAHASRLGCMRAFRNAENIGLQANLMRCLSLAGGQYVWMIGDDEIVETGALRLIVETLRAEALPLFVFNYSSEPHPTGANYLHQVYGAPIDTARQNTLAFVLRHGWLWTLGNLGMVVVRADLAQAVDPTPYLSHRFAQAAVYLEAFHAGDMRFVDRPVFRTFVKSQTVNKDRWETDGTWTSWKHLVDTLHVLVARQVIPAKQPLRFFNGCSMPDYPLWNYFLDRIIRRIQNGVLEIPDDDWRLLYTLFEFVDDDATRWSLAGSVASLQASLVATKLNFDKSKRLCEVLRPQFRRTG